MFKNCILGQEHRGRWRHPKNSKPTPI